MPARGRQQKRKTWVAGDAPSKKRDVKDTPSPRISPPPRRIAVSSPQRIAASPAADEDRPPPPSPPQIRSASPPAPPQEAVPQIRSAPQIWSAFSPPPTQTTFYIGGVTLPPRYKLAAEAVRRFKEFEEWFEGKWRENELQEYEAEWAVFQKAASQLKERIRDACRGKYESEEEEEEVKSSRVETGTQTEAAAPAKKENSEVPPKQRLKKHPSPPKKAKAKAKAVVVHGVSVSVSLVAVRQEMERRKKRERVIGVRWLLGRERREGKKESSVVVYFEKEVEVDDFYRIGTRRCRASVYEWDRGRKG